MKSPFPGMDPYLERHWQDVHQAICTYARDQMQGQLGSDLVARLNERLVESADEEPRTIYPDVRVVEQGIAGTEWTPSDPVGGVAVAEPLVLQLAPGTFTEAFVEIIERDSNRLITVIEFLSLSNKVRGKSREQYQLKQQEVADARVSLVEIDLIRSGFRTFLLPEAQFPPGRKEDYFVCVTRGWLRTQFELYPISRHEKLPAFRIPLRRNERDVVLNLQALLDQAYQNGRYDRTNYKEPCVPGLDADDTAWADQLLKAAGRR